MNGDVHTGSAANDRDRFGIGMGRARPAFKPKIVTCPNCRASLTVRDEAAVTLGCDYCGAALGMSGETVKALGLQDRSRTFPLKIGQRFDWKGHKYEVAARIALMEDKDPSEITWELLLYSPRRDTLWLSEYHGAWDLSRQTRVMPGSDPFAENAPGLLETGDGRKWIKSDAGTYEIAYVDGALPWEAKVGDTIRYAEFNERGGPLQYEAESSYGELEFSTGQALTREQLSQALGAGGGAPSAQAAAPPVRTTLFRRAMLIAAVVCVLNLVLAWTVGRPGTRVSSDSFQAAQISDGVTTGEFKVASDGNVIRVDVASPGLNNEWISYDLTLLEGETPLFSVDGQLEYFHGSEDGESWSEGSSHDSIYLKIPRAGTYRLAVEAEGGSGDQETAGTVRKGMRVEIFDGVRMTSYFFTMAMVSGACALLSLIIAYARRGGG